MLLKQLESTMESEIKSLLDTVREVLPNQDARPDQSRQFDSGRHIPGYLGHYGMSCRLRDLL